MSETAFTPGPWNVAGFGSQNNNKMDFGINTARGQLVIESYGECELDYKANAALIAAAPEMYDILEHYFNLIQTASEGAAIAEQKIFEDIACIESVLKKARGEQCGNAT